MRSTISHHSLRLLCLCLLLTACTAITVPSKSTLTPRPSVTTPITAIPSEPTLTPTTISTPAPTPTPAPRTLTLCLGSEPESLYFYHATSYAARFVLEAIYDGPIDVVDYTYRPVILEKLPSLADGDALIETVYVDAGDHVVNNEGKVVTLEDGMLIRPAGCRADDCLVTFEGTSQAMDRMRVVFKLKSDLRWSDGEALTASDSVYSYNLARDPETPKGKWLELRTEDYVAQDNLTIVWTGLPGYLDPAYATAFWTPLPEHAWQNYPANELPEQRAVSRTPLGYGPYAIQTWIPGQYIRALPNPHYFRGQEDLPFFDEITFRFLNNQDVDTALNALENGQCDILSLDFYLEHGITRLKEMEQAGKAKLYAIPSPIWEHLTFNIAPPSTYDQPPFFTDSSTRQAVATCINRQRIVDEVLYGMSFVSDSFLTSNHPLYAADQIIAHPFNPMYGQNLLDEIGWRDQDGDGVREAHGISGIPEGTPFHIYHTISTGDMRQQMSALIIEDLAACGIKMETETWETEEFFASGLDSVLYGRQFDLASFSWLIDVAPSCELYLSTEIPSPENQWDGQNFAGYANPDYDAACLASRRILPDEQGYHALHQETQRIFSKDLPALPLFVHPWIYASRPDLEGIQGTSFSAETWNIENFKLSP